MSTIRRFTALGTVVGRSSSGGGTAAEVARLCRYLIVGASSNFFTLAIYYALTFGTSLRPELAFALASAAALVLSYLANRTWTFESEAKAERSLPRYLLGYGGAFALQWTILYVGVHYFGFAHWWVVLVGLVTAAILFYVLQRLWVFSAR
jgi:putative flippase GtrA